MVIILNDLLDRYAVLECCREQILAAADILVDAYSHDGKLLVAGIRQILRPELCITAAIDFAVDILGLQYKHAVA